MWILLAAAVLVLPLLLLLVGRRSEDRTMKDWEMVLTHQATATLEERRSHVRAELDLLDWTYNRAQEARDENRPEQALELLNLGCRLIETYCPSMVKSLAAMSVLSRMVSAMAPVKPLRPAGFRLRELVQLARMNQFLHHFLVTAGERFRLRTMILARGFAMVLRILTRSTAELRDPLGPGEWERAAASRDDLRTLSEESIECLRVLLMALDAQRRTS